MNKSSEYDVIIIGARVAGSTLATILGEKGYSVLLLDRATFPSDTLSTHFFRAPAFRAFERIGILEEVKSVAPQLTVNYNVIDGIVFPEPVDRPEDYPFYMCVRRIILDDILVRRVKKIPNVELKEETRVKDLCWDNDCVIGIRWTDSNKEGESKAKVIVGADGLYSFMAKKINVQVEHSTPVNRAMYYAYYREISANEGPAAEFHYNGNTLVYCFPCDSKLTLLAASVPIIQFAEFKKDTETVFQKVLESMEALSPRLSYAVREGPIQGSGNIPGYLRVPYGKGWALVGDAGMVMDPWSGQGIDQATTHAVLLGDFLDNFLSGVKDWETAMRAYHRERNDFSVKTYQRTCNFSVDLRTMTKAALKRRGF